MTPTSGLTLGLQSKAGADPAEKGPSPCIQLPEIWIRISLAQIWSHSM